jgi:hypothetical protein
MIKRSESIHPSPIIGALPQGGSMTSQIVVRDVARIILPLSIFVGLFSRGPVSAAGFVICAFCVCYEMQRRLRKGQSVNEFKRA